MEPDYVNCVSLVDCILEVDVKDFEKHPHKYLSKLEDLARVAVVGGCPVLAVTEWPDPEKGTYVTVGYFCGRSLGNKVRRFFDVTLLVEGDFDLMGDLLYWLIPGKALLNMCLKPILERGTVNLTPFKFQEV